MLLSEKIFFRVLGINYPNHFTFINNWNSYLREPAVIIDNITAILGSIIDNFSNTRFSNITNNTLSIFNFEGVRN